MDDKEIIKIYNLDIRRRILDLRKRNADTNYIANRLGLNFKKVALVIEYASKLNLCEGYKLERGYSLNLNLSRD